MILNNGEINVETILQTFDSKSNELNVESFIPELFVNQQVFKILLEKPDALNQIFYADFVYKTGPYGSFAILNNQKNDSSIFSNYSKNKKNISFYLKFELVNILNV